MDPNANLREQEEVLEKLIALLLLKPAPGRARDAEYERGSLEAELRGFRTALDEWLSRGGFEPNWSAAPLARQYFDK